MAGLDYLWSNPPASMTSATSSMNDLPDWYQEMIRGIASKGTQIAGQGYQPFQGSQVAGFNPDQEAAFGQVRANQGVWQPAMGAALGSAGDIQSSISPNTKQWTDPGVAASYMSPYTKQVTDEIAREGNQNLNQNILPGISSTFTGNGQFGSARNAAAMGQGIEGAQKDITGAQSQALQAGYGEGAQIFGQDQSREQQQQEMNAAAADTSAQRYGALGQMQQYMGNQDTAALGAVGGQEQGLEQQGDTAAYNDYLRQTGWDWSQLGNIDSLLRGMPMNSQQTSTGGTQYQGAGVSPLGWLNALYGSSQYGNGSNGP